MNDYVKTCRPGDQSFAKCMECSLGLLARRPHATAELANKLGRRKFSLVVIESTLVELQRLGLLDDLQFAVMLLREKLLTGNRPLGQRRLFQELRRRGIGPEMGRQAWSLVEEEEAIEPEADRAYRAAARKSQLLVGDLEERKLRASLWRHLSGRGFAAEDTVAAIDRVIAEKNN